MNGSQDAFRAACAALFQADVSPGEQRDAAHRLHDLLGNLIGYQDDQADATATIDTFLPSGKAISLQGAARCLWEFARTNRFLRGVEAALRDSQTRFPGQRLRLLEAGCGPFALLALPLATRFRPDEVGFTLLDIHAHSLDAARRLVAALGLEAYVDDYVQADAAVWRCPEEKRPHVIVSETMQNGLKNEPQAAITRNLAPQLLPGGHFLPEAVSLSFALQTWCSASGDEAGHSVHHSPIPLFSLTPESAQQDAQGRIRMPDALPSQARPVLRTRIQVFRDITLEEGECSLTLPIRLRDLPPLAGSEELAFRYESGPRPGLHLTMTQALAA